MTVQDAWEAAAQAQASYRWAEASAAWNTAMTDALLSAASLSPDALVLDLAAGSGDPAIRIAQLLVAGRVIALDSSYASLLVAHAHAQQLGLESKMNCIQGDAHAIPLGRSRVNRITSRCGVMFFGDTGLVMSEILRVLKPGGRVALLAWGPFEQPFFQATIGIVLRRVCGAEMPPEAGKMFRFASPGSLERKLQAAGFCNVHEELVKVQRIWAASSLELWAYQQEVSTLCRPLFASIPPAKVADIDAEVSSALALFRHGTVLSVPVEVIVATGQRDR